MIPQYTHPPRSVTTAAAVELRAEHTRWRALPWAARRLARRHGLKPATARTIAELAGFAIDGGRR